MEPTNPAFGAVVREAVGDLSTRKAGYRASCSHMAIVDMLNGRVPRRSHLIRFADGLELTGEVRARLFREAGYLDPQAEEVPA